MPRVAVLGAGCIGQWVGGHLVAVGVDVVLIGRSVLRRTAEAKTLRLTDIERDVDGFSLSIVLEDTPRLSLCYDIDSALRPDNFDAVFVCLKCTDNTAAAPLKKLRCETVIVSLQNGVDSQRVLGELLPHHMVVAGMVPYGVVEVAPGYFRRGTFGAMAFTDKMPDFLRQAFHRAGLASDFFDDEDMRAVQWFKLVVNLGNALNALVGKPLVECMEHQAYRQLLAATWEEGWAVLKARRVRLQGDVNGKALEKVLKLLRLPSVLLRLAQRMGIGPKAIDASYHASMFYDLEQHRNTEIDELNGRIVSLAADMGMPAPVNAMLSDLIQQAQEARRGSPRIPIDDLLKRAESVAADAFSSPPRLNWWLLSGLCLVVVATIAGRAKM